MIILKYWWIRYLESELKFKSDEKQLYRQL